jgi:hypothetical protein
MAEPDRPASPSRFRWSWQEFAFITLTNIVGTVVGGWILLNLAFLGGYIGTASSTASSTARPLIYRAGWGIAVALAAMPILFGLGALMVGMASFVGRVRRRNGHPDDWT